MKSSPKLKIDFKLGKIVPVEEVAGVAEAFRGSYEGGGPYLGDAARCFKWYEVKAYPVARLLKLVGTSARFSSRANWIHWFEIEKQEREDYEAFEDDYAANPFSFPWLVVAELPGNKVDIGDGYHRAAVALKRKMKFIPAIVGIGTGKDGCPKPPVS